MPPVQGDPAGFLISLFTESFAVRALLGSLAAAGLAALLVGAGFLRTRRARRLAILAPVLTAAVAGLASIGEVYLPQVWVAGSEGVAGSLIDAFGEQRELVTVRALVLLYAFVAGVLVCRRLLGLLAVRRTLRRGSLVADHDPLARELAALAAGLGVRTPRLYRVHDCPGGAFTIGLRRAAVAVDPALITQLDDHEREGLLAHELSHLRRRDTATALTVGLCRDLAFFLPPLHLAVRWLRREQEEGADELASTFTGRPVALASSILKVWQGSRDRKALAGVCAAVPGRVALPSGVLLAGPATSETLRTITARVERLIARLPAPTRLRQCVEAGVASVALVAGALAALTVPSWLTERFGPDAALSFGVFSAAPAAPVESPAFATFRQLAPAASAAVATTPASIASGAMATQGCPCVESQAQLRRGEVASGEAAPNRLAWGSADRPTWEVRAASAEASVRTARPLATWTEAGPQVGLFLVSGVEG